VRCVQGHDLYLHWCLGSTAKTSHEFGASVEGVITCSSDDQPANTVVLVAYKLPSVHTSPVQADATEPVVPPVEHLGFRV
jgi:hypothetical protein